MFVETRFFLNTGVMAYYVDFLKVVFGTSFVTMVNCQTLTNYMGC